MAELTNASVLAHLEKKFSGAVLHHEESYGMLTIEVPASEVISILSALYKDEELEMTFLTDLTAVHYPEQKDREIAVVYHLHSLVNNYRLRIKAFIPEENPRIATATTVHASANWMERETYDFFGIQFEGHPDLRRILNVDDLGYFPLLKQYRLEDGTRTDKDDRFFGRDGHEGVAFDKRVDRR